MIVLMRKSFHRSRIRFVRKSQAEDDAILQAASKMEGKLAKAFIDAVDHIKGTVAMDKLVEAFASGDSNMVLSVLALDKSFTDTLAGKGLEAGIKSFRDAIQSTYSSGATAGISKLPSTVSTDLSFNLMSRESIEFLQNYEFGLIRDISQQATDSIRQILIRSFQEGGHPTQQARQIRDVIGLTPNQEQAVASFRESLKSGDMTNALGRALRDGRYDRTLEAHRAAGTVPSDTAADKMVSRYAERYVNHRATTIARTESVRASNMGQRQVWDQAQKQGLLAHDQQRVWITSGDDRTCEICEELDGETAGLNEEFDTGIMEPPDPHPDCRCTTALA